MVDMSHRVMHLDDFEAIPGPGSLTWHPVRAQLGIRAFGTNAYTAAEAGQDVVEPHTESPITAHEELYFVARGRATFTIDGDTFDAPAGTYVFIPDVSSHRHAVAAEPGTTVLSFGGPPTFEPSAWEWSFRAAARHEDPDAARAILAEGFERHPDSPSLFYELACIEVVAGSRDAALVALRRAVELEPNLAPWAAKDDDLAALRDDPDFAALLAPSGSETST
jgi:mannose-6-phosphate isomerase-like protein (cupin superfamily)